MARPKQNNKLLSIVIPVKDEEESLPILYKELKKELLSLNFRYEMLYIDDGSEDNSYTVLTKLARIDKNIRIIQFRANFGKSAALARGFDEAKGDIIMMIDADLQDNPKELPRLIKKLDDGFDLVTGWRKNRNDTPVKKISSKLFNTGTAWLTGVTLHDFNCGLKVMRASVAHEIPMYGELHRFIPLLAAKRRFRVAEVIVSHRTRKYGASKYGFGRSWRGILDLFTTILITDYASKPSHFFGRIGIISFATGFLMDGYVTYLKITTGTTQDKIPLLLAGILCMVVGVQLISTGFIAELISYQNYKQSHKKMAQEG